MKKIAVLISFALFCANIFAVALPSLDGRAAVAKEGELPSGLFAKSVGYLPGDSVTVTNPATGEMVDVLILGAIDPSQGVAILLSKEAALRLNIKSDSNMQVKLTKRVGGLDQSVSGTAVIAESAGDDALQTKENIPKVESPSVIEGDEEQDTAKNDEKEPLQPVALQTQETQKEDVPVSTEPVIVDAPSPVSNGDVAMQPVIIADAEPASLQMVPQETPKPLVETAPQKPVQKVVIIEENPSPVAPTVPAIIEEKLPPVQNTPPSNVLAPPSSVSPSSPLAPPSNVLAPPSNVLAPPSSNVLAPPPVVAQNPYVEQEPEIKKESDIIEENVATPLECDDATQECNKAKSLDYEEFLATLPKEILEKYEAGTVQETPAQKQETLLPQEKTQDLTEEVIILDDNATAQTTQTAPLEQNTNTAQQAEPQDKTQTPQTQEEKKEYTPIVLVPAQPKTPEPQEPQETKEEQESPQEKQDTPLPLVQTEKEPEPPQKKYMQYVAKDGASELKTGAYYVQIATLKNEDNLDRIVLQYANNYPMVLVYLPSKDAYQVLIGSLCVDEYGVVLQRFKDHGFKDAFAKKIR